MILRPCSGPQAVRPYLMLAQAEKCSQAEYQLGLRLKRDAAAFFGEWRRRAALQAQYRRVLGAAVARLIDRTLASALQRWRERAQWQVWRALSVADGPSGVGC